MKIQECEMCAYLIDGIEQVEEINTGSVETRRTTVARCPVTDKNILHINKCPKTSRHYFKDISKNDYYG